MKILSCDTSTLLGSVAVSDGDKILSYRSLQRAGSHSDTLNVMIRECLDESTLDLKDIDLFLSGLGPGSFTGIRISVNTIKSLAYVHNKPCAGLDSLYLMAASAKNISKSITTMINAFKNMVYIAEYKTNDNNNLEVIKAPQVVRVQDLKEFLNFSSLIVGDGYSAYENYFKNSFEKKMIRNNKVLDFPQATTLCHSFIARLDEDFQKEKYHWSTLMPIYLRASEAEENLKGIKYIPLAMR